MATKATPDATPASRTDVAPGVTRSEFVQATLRQQESRSTKRLTVARTIVFSSIFFWLWANYGFGIAWANAPYLLLFIVNGLALYVSKERLGWGIWIAYVTVLVDVVLLALTLLAPGRTYPEEWPWALVLRQPSFLYWLLVPVLSVLSFRPLLVLWSGLCVAVVWSVGVGFIVNDPNVLTALPDPATVSQHAILDAYLDRHYVHLDDNVVRIFLTLLISAILAAAAWQVRKLLFRQAEVARQRANLSRFVAPNMVEKLAAMDRPFGDDRQIIATVLFADIKGFTALAEDLSPAEAMRLLREFHGQMAEQVFAHNGTLDKFIGDGLLATFGTPEAHADDTRRAVACGRAMTQRLDAFNAESERTGQPVIRVGIGIHRGPVIMGEIGSPTRLEFAVIGDTVNVASRIENLTRDLKQTLLVSGDVVARAREEGDDVNYLSYLGEFTLRGRNEPTALWGWHRNAAGMP
ncbi:MAG: adenylate/guanylate cyclase domain-containing protein [Pseudomonadota bacterium]